MTYPFSPPQLAIVDDLRRQYAEVEASPLPTNLGALLDKAAKLHGDRICWVQLDDRDEEGESFSFTDIQELVARCATVFSERGIGAGDRVALMLPNCAAFVISWFACARLGASIIPINSRYTAHELEHVLSLTDPNLAVVDKRFVSSFAQTSNLAPDRLLVHDIAAPEGSWQRSVASAAAMTQFPSVKADTLVNLQFTSGSTGRPKACMLPHSYWLVLARCRALQGPQVSRILLDMPFHYMGGQWRFLLSLQMGATVYVAERPSLSRMIDRLLKHQIEFCSITPAFAKQPLDPRRGELVLKWVATMAMPPDLLPAVSERLGGVPVRELYGTTETGAIAAMPVEVDWAPGGVGLATPFRQLEVRDSAGRRVPNGVPGQLCVSGPGLMLGYYRDQEATLAVLKDGWFLTGDLCTIDENGFTSIVGRIKDTIRRSGENISATEVENALARLDFIEEVAALAVPDEIRGEELMVCVTLAPDSNKCAWSMGKIAASIAERASECLAPFKHPRYITLLSAMPRTSSGKIAKAELRNNLKLWCVETMDTTQSKAL